MSVRDDNIILNWTERERINEILSRLILVYSLESDELDFPEEVSVRIQLTSVVSFRGILESLRKLVFCNAAYSCAKIYSLFWHVIQMPGLIEPYSNFTWIRLVKWFSFYGVLIVSYHNWQA